MRPDESRTAYDGALVSVTVERWGDNEREIVEHPGAVAIVADRRRAGVWLVRQLREATRGELPRAAPAGTREEGEEPLATAQRELREECGFTGGRWRGRWFWTTPGFSREHMVVFLAEDVEPVEREPDDDEEVEVVRVPVADIRELLAGLADAKSIAGLALYLNDRGG